MRVYIIVKYAFCEFRGIALVTVDKIEAENYCKHKNKASRELEYHILTKQLKGINVQKTIILNNRERKC